MKAGRKLLVMQGKRGFDQPCNSRRRLQVTDIGFYRADGAVIVSAGGGAKSIDQGQHFDGIAKIGGGAVRFNIGNRIGVHVCRGHGIQQDPGLAFNSRSGIAGLLSAIIIYGRAFDHSIDMAAVFNGIFQALEHHCPHAVAEVTALGLLVKGTAMSIRR